MKDKHEYNGTDAQGNVHSPIGELRVIVKTLLTQVSKFKNESNDGVDDNDHSSNEKKHHVSLT